MGKRLNPQRRLRQAQAKALAAVRLEQSAANAAEMAKLQQGPVRSGMRGNPTTMTFRGPKWSDIDVPGKAKRKRPQRWSKTK
jgi:hypothetical protein